MLTLADIAKRYGTRTLFAEVGFTILRGDRCGLVGANGAGKRPFSGSSWVRTPPMKAR